MQSTYRNARRRGDPTSPTGLLGSALVPKLIILALLAIALFFFVRAVLPPRDGPSSTASVPAEAPTPEVAASDQPVSAQQAKISPRSDSEPVGGLADVTADTAPHGPPNKATDADAASTGVTGVPDPNGPLAVPGSQIEAIKRVFAPELLIPADAGPGSG
jgi:hypothetical protein